MHSSYLKAVPEVDVQDLPAQPVQHQVGWVSDKQASREGWVPGWQPAKAHSLETPAPSCLCDSGFVGASLTHLSLHCLLSGHTAHKT